MENFRPGVLDRTGTGQHIDLSMLEAMRCDAGSGPACGVPEPGEHTGDILREWTGRAE